eukprot:gene6117-6821_t
MANANGEKCAIQGCPAKHDLAGRAENCKGCPGQAYCNSQREKTDPDQEIIQIRMRPIKHKLLILSGKGGVGKSSIASALSMALANLNKMVGVCDLDICGPSIPFLLNVPNENVVHNSSGWQPLKSPHGDIKVMSVGSLLRSNDHAVIWRGPRKSFLIKRFLKDTFWGILDFLVFDTPPGTSDEHLSVVQALQNIQPDGAVLITTPQDIALNTIKKEINFCRKMNVNIMGIISNMTGYVCPCCKENFDLFVHKDLNKLCEEYGIRFLGKLPLDGEFVKCCEEGRSVFDLEENPVKESVMEIANKILEIYGRSFCTGFVIGLPIYITITDFGFCIARVDGVSMQPSLNPVANESDVVFLNRWTIRNVKKIERGDIVSLISPSEPDVKLIKRVVGLEGDVVRTIGYKKPYVFVPKGHCWLEGDHRGRSFDSNSFGPVSLGLINGLATHVLWPPKRWQKLDRTLKSDRVAVKKIKKGFVPNMKVEGVFYVNEFLEKLMFEELKQFCSSGGVGGFLPGTKQVANVAALPGIIGRSVGLPDIHAGYGFAIGNMAAFDMSDPSAIVSPGGVGFDINCGVRLLRTNLNINDVQPVKEQLAQSMFDHIPVGVGSKGIIPMGAKDLEEALEMGMDWSLREGYAWAEDKEHCEEYGRMLQADPSKVSFKAKKRGLPQLGTLGAGNHYAEIQVVDEIYNDYAAKTMGIDHKGQVCIMIHCGSRGLGHQVATDALVQMERAMGRDKIEVNDKQLACARISSEEGQNYLKGMAAAANYAWVNRSSMTFLCRQAFSKIFKSTPDDLDMHVIYDVSHNVAKVEEHLTGQPVLIGGTMGTCSYVLTGTEKGMEETFGSTCHGAGRAMSRSKSRRNLDYHEVLSKLAEKGISIRVASPKLVMEEAPESYKNVTDVVDTCHAAGISRKCVKLKPLAVIKG